MLDIHCKPEISFRHLSQFELLCVFEVDCSVHQLQKNLSKKEVTSILTFTFPLFSLPLIQQEKAQLANLKNLSHFLKQSSHKLNNSLQKLSAKEVAIVLN